jgi:hypothetical protein
MENGKRFYRPFVVQLETIFVDTREGQIRLSLSGFTVECILLVKCALLHEPKATINAPSRSHLLLAFVKPHKGL